MQTCQGFKYRELVRPADPSNRFVMHVLQIACCKLHALQIACVANYTCYKLHVLQIQDTIFHTRTSTPMCPPITCLVGGSPGQLGFQFLWSLYIRVTGHVLRLFPIIVLRVLSMCPQDSFILKVLTNMLTCSFSSVCDFYGRCSKGIGRHNVKMCICLSLCLSVMSHFLGL